VTVDSIICDLSSTSCVVHSIQGQGQQFQVCNCLPGYDRDPGDVTRCLSEHQDQALLNAEHPACSDGYNGCDPKTSTCVEYQLNGDTAKVRL
jgi:hypothetical protein